VMHGQKNIKLVPFHELVDQPNVIPLLRTDIENVLNFVFNKTS